MHLRAPDRKGLTGGRPHTATQSWWRKPSGTPPGWPGPAIGRRRGRTCPRRAASRASISPCPPRPAQTGMGRAARTGGTTVCPVPSSRPDRRDPDDARFPCVALDRPRRPPLPVGRPPRSAPPAGTRHRLDQFRLRAFGGVGRPAPFCGDQRLNSRPGTHGGPNVRMSARGRYRQGAGRIPSSSRVAAGRVCRRGPLHCVVGHPNTLSRLRRLQIFHLQLQRAVSYRHRRPRRRGRAPGRLARSRSRYMSRRPERPPGPEPRHPMAGRRPCAGPVRRSAPSAALRIPIDKRAAGA